MNVTLEARVVVKEDAVKEVVKVVEKEVAEKEEAVETGKEETSLPSASNVTELGTLHVTVKKSKNDATDAMVSCINFTNLRNELSRLYSTTQFIPKKSINCFPEKK